MSKETIKLKLYNGDFKGETVNTTCSFGEVTFDEKGCAEVDATEEDMAKLEALKWVGEPPPPVLTIEEQARLDLPREDVALYSADFAGQEVNTSFGKVKFNAQGMASWNATQEELAKFRALGWLLHPQPDLENLEHALKNEPLKGPTIEEFVNAGYLPENYPPAGYEEIPSAGLKQYKETGKGPWDDRAIDSLRQQRQREAAESERLRTAQEASLKAQAEIADRRADEAARGETVKAPAQPTEREPTPEEDAAAKKAANEAAEKAKAEIAAAQKPKTDAKKSDKK